MLLKSGSMSKLVIKGLELKLWSSSANVRESTIVYSLGPSNGIKLVKSWKAGCDNFSDFS